MRVFCIRADFINGRELRLVFFNYSARQGRYFSRHSVNTAVRLTEPVSAFYRLEYLTLYQALRRMLSRWPKVL